MVATDLVIEAMPLSPNADLTVWFKHLSKSFGTRTVVRDVSFHIAPGEVVALLGQNGSGKSTLIKLLSGYYEPDRGSNARLVLDRGRLDLPLHQALQGFRISCVHQDLALLPNASVTENLLIGSFAARPLARLSWRALNTRAKDMLAAVGADAIDPKRLVSNLRPVERAMVAIARAINELGDRGLLILDEITAFLTADGIDSLFNIVREVAARDIGVIFVSHRMEEIWRICDRALVLRNGELVEDVQIGATSVEDLISNIVGHRLDWLYPRKETRKDDVKLSVRALRTEGVLGLDLEARRGEIVGLTGLRGMGSDRIIYALYGASPKSEGTIEIDGQLRKLSSLSPRNAYALGIRLVPSDRLVNGAVGDVTVRENASLPHLQKFMRLGFLRRRDEIEWASHLLMEYGVQPSDPEEIYLRLSGGNQQKVLLARWLETEPSVLLLDEPTQGVDVGARRDIFSRIVAAAGRGVTVLYSSSETNDLAELCHRVVIFRDGRMAGELDGDLVTEENISRLCWGGEILEPSDIDGEPEV